MRSMAITRSLMRVGISAKPASRIAANRSLSTYNLAFSSFSFGVLVALGWTQNFLAKNDPGSKLYWRNSPSLADAAFQVAHNKYVDRSISLFKLFSGAGFDFSELKITLEMIKKLQQLKHMFDKIDDVVDGSRPRYVMALGNASLGKELNPFLLALLNEQDLALIEKLINEGLITKEEIFSFGNLLANKLHNQAVLTLKYEDEADPAKKAILREKIAAENLELAGVYFALIVHLTRKDKRIAEIVGHQPLDYESVAKVYPIPVRAGRLMQIVHDTIEFRYDLRQEFFIGKICANYFLARLESEQVLHQSKAKLAHLPDRAVSYYELPAGVQLVLSKVKKDYCDESRELGAMSSIVYKAAWHYKSRVGFFLDKPKHETLAARQAALHQSRSKL